MTLGSPIGVEARVEVRDDYVNDRALALHDIFPKSKVHARRTNKKIGSYRVPDFNNSLVKGDLPSYFEGDPGPSVRPPGDGTVTLGDPSGYATHADQNNLEDPLNERFKRYASRIRRHYDQCHRQLDRSIFSFLTNTTYFTQESFTAPDLDDFNAGSKPAKDITAKLRTTSDGQWLRAVQGLMSENGRFELWAVMDSEVARTLSGHHDYSGRSVLGSGLGAGSGVISGNTSGRPVYMPMADFAEVFRSVHGLNRVHVIDSSLYDSAHDGQTSSVRPITDGLLWIGIVDTGSYDLTTSGEGPDGSFAILMPDPQRPQDNLWTPQDGSKVERYSAHIEYTLVAPRQSSDSKKLGIFYDATTIFS